MSTVGALTHTQRVRMLYKTILRLHRGLPEEMRSLGDIYVRDEFRRHKKCNQGEAVIFMTEWTNYAVIISKQLGLRGPKTAKKLGKQLNVSEFEKFSDEQIHQLYELMLAVTNKNEDQHGDKQ